MATHDGPYVALIGDIRGSRTLEDREAAQQEFAAVVDALNAELPDRSIASAFTITTGDEFQGLLTDAADAVAAVVAASDRFQPARLRFGLGCGGLDTALNSEQAIGMDGPCFHRARSAIEAAGRDGAWVRVRGWGALDEHADALFDLLGCVRDDWTDRQAQFARALTEVDTQRRVAERYEVSSSTVSESLSAGHVHEVRRAEDALAALLGDRLAGGERG